jgi:hypothetical protein
VTNSKPEARISKRFDKLTALLGLSGVEGSEVEGQIRMTKIQNPKQQQSGKTI